MNHDDTNNASISRVNPDEQNQNHDGRANSDLHSPSNNHSVTTTPSEKDNDKGKDNDKEKGKDKDKPNRKSSDDKDGHVGDSKSDAKDMKNRAGGDDEGKKNQSNSTQNAVSKAGSTATGATTGMKFVGFAKLLGYLKAFLNMLMNMASVVTATVSSLITMITSMIATAAATIGISVTLMTVGLFGIVGTITVIGVTAVVNHITETNVANKDTLDDDCSAEVDKAKAGDITEIDSSVEETAQLCYSVLHSAGFRDNTAAGIIGNWSSESGIDSTGVETIYDEPYKIGERKQSFWDMSFDMASFDSSYHARFPKIIHAGLGLGQWTDTTDGSVRHTKLLQYAEKNNKNWYDLDLQLAFLLQENLWMHKPAYVDKRYSNLMDWGTNCEASASDCAKMYLACWEGIMNDTLSDRQEAAEQWAVLFATWDVDEDFANSVIEMSEVTIGEATNESVKNKSKNCKDVKIKGKGNDSIADAAVSYAYLEKYKSRDTNGASGSNGASQFKQYCTPLYIKVHDAVISASDTYYSSCDRGMASAVRWAGADDDMEYGGTSAILTYLSTSDKWQEITEYYQANADTTLLQPGDVFIYYGGGTHGHTGIYVGAEAAKKQYPNDVPDTCTNAVVHASYGSRGPRLDLDMAGFGNTGSRIYHVYRNVKPETDSKYKTAIESE